MRTIDSSTLKNQVIELLNESSVALANTRRNYDFFYISFQ